MATENGRGREREKERERKKCARKIVCKFAAHYGTKTWPHRTRLHFKKLIKQQTLTATSRWKYTPNAKKLFSSFEEST